MYIAELKDGSKKYIIPMLGKGLWGPVWGFIALNDDLNTIYGASFDHKSETPGLGAEINTPMFMDPFKSKQIFNNNGEFVSISVVKGGAKPEDNSGVDAITGGTITSKGVEDMIKKCLEPYVAYLNELKKEGGR